MKAGNVTDLNTDRQDCAVQRNGMTHFDFKSRVFATPGAHFLLHGPQRTPVFALAMGDGEAMVQIDALRTEFKILRDSPDGRLIELAIKGLRHVPDIRPGDRIPSEVLDGTASWSVLPRHKQIVEKRLQAQLISSVSGKETVLTKVEDLVMFLEQIENKEKIRDAFIKAAVALGLPRDNTGPVFERIEILGRELCYIEALRDKFNEIEGLDRRLALIGGHAKADRKTRSDVERVRAMLKKAVEQFNSIFQKADARTSKIIAALEGLEGVVAFIRQTRDELHFQTIEWEPILQIWRAATAPNAASTLKGLDQTYRFLALRFSSSRSLLHQDREGRRAG